MRYNFWLIALLSFLSLPATSIAQGAIGGLDVNGAIYQIDQKTGEIHWKAESPFNAFELGATARKGDDMYYVAQPSGSTQSTLYKSSLKKGTISQVALDRSDPVRVMFFEGKKLFAFFYNGNTGTLGLFKINPKTGATTLVFDLSDTSLEPIPGALTKLGKVYYLLTKPEADTTKRVLVKFKAKAGSKATQVEVLDSAGASILCNKIKFNTSKKNFVCLASNADETEVRVCSLSKGGTAKCASDAIPGILRIGSGHTMLSKTGKSFYAFGYAPDEPDNQRMIVFNAKGKVKTNVVVSTILIGAHFKEEAEPAV